MKTYVCIEGETIRVVAKVHYDEQLKRFTDHLSELKVERKERNAMGERTWVKDPYDNPGMALENIIQGLISGKVKVHPLSEIQDTPVLTREYFRLQNTLRDLLKPLYEKAGVNWGVAQDTLVSELAHELRGT